MRLSDQASPVNRHGMSGREGRALGTKPNDRVGDFLRSTDAAEGMLVGDSGSQIGVMEECAQDAIRFVSGKFVEADIRRERVEKELAAELGLCFHPAELREIGTCTERAEVMEAKV